MNTGVGCHTLLQGIFPTQGSNTSLLCLLRCRQILHRWATREALFDSILTIKLQPHKDTDSQTHTHMYILYPRRIWYNYILSVFTNFLRILYYLPLCHFYIWVLCLNFHVANLSETSFAEVWKWSESESRSVVSDSLRPHGLYSPWNSPAQNTGVGSLSLLQGIFPIQGSNLGLPHCRRILYQPSYQGNRSVFLGNYMHLCTHARCRFSRIWLCATP